MTPPPPKKHRGGSPTKFKRNVKQAGAKRRLAEKWNP